ncbi:TAT-binding protein-like protein 7, AAA ATPase [Saccharomyces pastorianus]|uniref:TAT-binding protein-like protein 7, AAA ATPase n=1 Tax=Saccharomyces pastorianus TaxID=27292 RepID=A0A6C1E9P6_SACPS|nr:TAT-binding protein-like protein 7, AAA ATPase [Saccharomyces pastorianus]
MTRNLRNRRDSDDKRSDAEDTNNANVGYETQIKDENGIIHTTSRSLRKINYAEIEKVLDFLEDDQVMDADQNQAKHETPVKAESNEYNESSLNGDEDGGDDDVVLPYKNTRVDDELPSERNLRKRKIHDPEEEDESFHEEDVDDDEEEEEADAFEDEYLDEDARNNNRQRRAADRKFIVPDPDDDDEYDEDGEEGGAISHSASSKRLKRANSRRTRSSHHPETPPPVRRELRSRTRHSRTSNEENDGDNEHNRNEALTLADEIRELQEDSPVKEKRFLRERTKPVNYKLPPPLTATSAEEFMNRNNNALSFHNPSPARRGRGGWNASQNSGPTRRLFPTGGPFGGNDVTTIFGKNTNFYNQVPSAYNNDNNNNKLILDSDSSDDEILPLGATPKVKKVDAQKKKKKKPEIADLDPLGVDMNINFDDIGGLDNYIDQLKEMVALPLLYPELYQNFNITPPRGVLFHGPPGTGKTLMARALAASCSSDERKITFFMRKGADILSKWVGEAERQLRLLFEEAKKQQPSIIFFDEIDGLAPVRSSKQEQIHASIVSTLLALMDGMDNRGQVIVIGATNRPDAVDPALRRPGRFDREFYFPLPDVKARSKILQIQTKKWTSPLSIEFINKLAILTKGYGGADLRSLCTEAALISIQRNFPQIYRSNDKLLVDPSKIKVKVNDFMLALKKIVPSSARSTGSSPQPLPELIKPLLVDQVNNLKEKLDYILKKDDSDFQKTTSLLQDFIDYEEYSEEEEEDEDDYKGFEGASKFRSYEFFDSMAESQICKPRLLINGPKGNGQQYVGAALLNYLEDFNVQNLDLASLVSESSRTIEAAVVQSFMEAKKRQPSVVFIPNMDIWINTIPENVILVLSGLFRSLQSNEMVLLLCLAEDLNISEIKDGILSDFAFDRNIFHLNKPSIQNIMAYYSNLIELLKTKPSDIPMKRKRVKPLPELPKVISNATLTNFDENGEPLSENEVLRRKLKTFQHQDMRSKNVLKIKLSGLMDLFKNRYKRFRKPPIDDAFLVHLFEPDTNADPSWQPAYIKDMDMILEISTGRRFFNMDLDIVEERLWNGYYSEPKQFLKDIELIYRDANTIGDRERVIKASEMFANAQMGIEEISTPDFIQECKATRQRDLERQELFLKDEENRVAIDLEAQQEEQQDILPQPEVDVNEVGEFGVAAGNQLQAQLQATANTNSIVSNGEVPAPIDTEIYKKHEAILTPSTVGTGEVLTPKDGGAHEQRPSESLQSSCIIHEQINDDKQTVAPLNQSDPLLLSEAKDGPSESAFKTSEIKQVTESLPINNSTCIGAELLHKGEKTGEQDATTITKEVGKPQRKKKDSRDVILSSEQLKEISERLIEHCKNFTVSQLEDVHSSIAKIIWRNRSVWDKTDAVADILKFLSE